MNLIFFENNFIHFVLIGHCLSCKTQLLYKMKLDNADVAYLLHSFV